MMQWVPVYSFQVIVLCYLFNEINLIKWNQCNAFLHFINFLIVKEYMLPDHYIFVRNKWDTVNEKNCHDFRHTAGASTVIPLILDNLYCSEIIYFREVNIATPAFFLSPIVTLVTRSLLSMSLSLFLFCKYIYLYHILVSTYKWYHTVFIFLLLVYFT